ncbi:MAG: bifunctional salicylyl-CoA 5-hydroxylase/oxidoreductase [Acidobacteria bacterium]|nr:MAG: bifunctional salicylyl-CoA 5-hydroxylase/oxidoreductase [Acidobacteriota bacterium]
MKIGVIGGGPAGLYFALLAKKAWPQHAITVVERNRADDTFGWGVVFSDETLEVFEAADGETYDAITARFKHWQEIQTFYRGTKTTSTGHGFAALSRHRLLAILQRRCRALGVTLRFEQEVAGLDHPELADADLIVGADGVNSMVRRRLASSFGPRLDHRKCKFCWLGTSKPLDAFTFIFEESPHGLFVVHAYPFSAERSTWIVECREETWRRAGLETASEDDTVAFCQQLFAGHLGGHPLLSNRSLWRTFPTVRCDRWYRAGGAGEPPVVLLGDAAHTAHFSIGSGTKMAMEDAIVLVETFRRHGWDGDLAAVLQAYEDARWVDVVKLQKAAQTSLEWFENAARYMGQHPLQLTFNLMTRSKRITYDNLRQRDPALVERVDALFRRQAGAVEERPDQETPDLERPGRILRRPPPPIFMPYELRGMRLENRIVVSPMCQYSAADGLVGDWHLVHLGSRAIGGAGLLMTEMTDVLAEGRITPHCAGLYRPEHRDAWRRIVDFVHARSDARIGLQIAHAGRKGSTRHPWEGEDVPLAPEEGAWPTIAPSALPYHPDWPVPRAMDRDDMDRVRDAFVRAARWAAEAGFDLLEIHMAHGYLLSSFISPLANRRRDRYGGSLANRMRYPLEVFAAVRAVWPRDRPMAVRISASDWMADGSGTTPEEAVAIARMLRAEGLDLIDVSSGGNAPDSEPEYGRMYQVPFAEKIRYEVGMPVMCVGALLGADHANTVLAAGRADLTAMARPHLHDAYLTLHAAERYGYWDQPWPGQYLLGRPRPPKPPERR